MFVVRKAVLCLLGCILFGSICAQREVFRPGPQPVKSFEELTKLDGVYKSEETLKFIRSSTTKASQEVYALVDECLRLSKDAQRPDLIGGLLCGKAVLKLQDTDTSSALQLLQNAENYLQQVNDKKFADNVINALAIGYSRAGNNNKAIELNKRLLDMFEDIPENRMRRLFAYRNLGNAYMRAQKTKEAIAAIEKAVSYAQETSNETLLQDTKMAAALMYANLNLYPQAFSIIKDIIPSINRLPGRAAETLHMVLAQSYQTQGEFDKANEYYQKLRGSANQTVAVSAYVHLLLNSIKTNQRDSIELYFSSLQNLSFKNQKSEPTYYLALAAYYGLKNQSASQVANLKKAIASDKIGGAATEAKVALAAHYSEKGIKDSADYFFTSAGNNISTIRKDANLYATYLSSLKRHQLRYKVTDSLISVLNAELQIKDSLHAANSFAITKDLETQYKVSEKEYQLNQLAQQRKLDQLKLKEQKQQTWIAALSLSVVLIVFGAIAFILQNKRKQNERIHALEMRTLKSKHQVELMQALDRAQEKERRSIADKLHDEVGAMLSVLKLNLSGNTKQNLTGTDKSLQTSLNIVDTLAGEIRNLSHTLMPVVVEKYGMIRGIKDLTEQINTAGKLKVELIVTGFDNEYSVSVNQQMHLYRIVQELMNNIIKHSGATHALVQLVEHENSISLIVEDNGKGLTQSDNGNGLHVLNSKIMLLNGEMNIDSQVGSGTGFIIEIPKNTNTPLLYEKNQNNVSG